MKFMNGAGFFSSWAFSWMLAANISACKTTEVDNSPEGAFNEGKKLFDDEAFEQSIQKLDEFKARYPYNKLVSDARLMIADGYFNKGDYAEASAHYEHFLKLFPNHVKTAWARYRLGMASWQEAPNVPSRDQELTKDAIEKWQTFLELHAKDDLAQEVKKFIELGKSRLKERELIIFAYHFRRGNWPALVLRAQELIEKEDFLTKEEKKEILLKAAQGFKELAASDFPTLLSQKFSKDDLLEKSNELSQMAKVL